MMAMKEERWKTGIRNDVQIDSNIKYSNRGKLDDLKQSRTESQES